MTVRIGPTHRNACCMPAGFNSNHVAAHRAHTQGRGDPSFDVFGTHRAVQQQDLDQFTGSLCITVNPARCCPERLMGAGERPRLAGTGRSSGSRQWAGFVLENLEVVIQLDRLPPLGCDPLMPGSNGSTVKHHNFGCPQPGDQ